MGIARRSAAWWLVLLAATGCRQIFGLSDPIDGGTTGDGPRDGSGSDGPDGSGSHCYGETGWVVCLSAPPSQPASLSGGVDTESTVNCATSTQASWMGNGQPNACFIVGTTVSVNNAYATGTRPLVIVASDSITVASLDVSAHGGGADPGAGANSFNCNFAGTPQTAATGAGGGAGGTFASAGGDGGSGNNAAASGGMASTGAAPTVLRGGCRGQSGGDGSVAGSRGSGSDGGGAVYLVAGNTITITGSINASGGGGRGASGAYGGGGGGGSGGMIVLYAATFDASGATLIANGGGGGAGGTSAGGGSDGAYPTTSNPTSAATGGQSGGGHGGNGAAGSSAAGNGMAGGGNLGGGGGGGDTGYIRANHALTGAATSPNVAIQ